jgi:hypothetical protein
MALKYFSMKKSSLIVAGLAAMLFFSSCGLFHHCGECPKFSKSKDSQNSYTANRSVIRKKF